LTEPDGLLRHVEYVDSEIIRG